VCRSLCQDATIYQEAKGSLKCKYIKIKITKSGIKDV
jgi:hypothetical protein